MSYRLQSMGQYRYRNGFKVTLQSDLLERPNTWTRSRMIFVNSMSDLFHEAVPAEFIKAVFHTMNESSQHLFQVLTKRSKRLHALSDDLIWGDNIWMGVSVEDITYSYRIEHLRKTKAKVKFLSLEPLIGPLPELSLQGIDWVIVGGESGPGARSIEADWILDIRDKCSDNDVPFFFKQWGGVNKRENGRTLEGQTYDQYPTMMTSEA
jgi:protein gp37